MYYLRVYLLFGIVFSLQCAHHNDDEGIALEDFRRPIVLRRMQQLPDDGFSQRDQNNMEYSNLHYYYLFEEHAVYGQFKEG